MLESDKVGECYKNSQSSIDRTFNKIIEQHNADYEAIINHQKELIQEVEQITPPEVSTNDIKEDSINEIPKESLKEKHPLHKIINRNYGIYIRNFKRA